MNLQGRCALVAISAGILFAACFAPTTYAGPPYGRAGSRVLRVSYAREEGTPTERLAEKIDDLEEHIEKYGSVVAKQPDIWGESRLTKYRQEFEDIMAEEKDDFAVTINAAISRSDQAFAASATALQAAVGDATPPDATGLVSTTDQVIQRNGARQGLLGFGEKQAIALEPTLRLSQQSTYLNHLFELRRISDGDDTSDSPGYALNLLRIPVSVLPGKKTREGHAAEVTMTVTPIFGEEFLQQTLRDLIINDVADQLALPITRVLRDDKLRQAIVEFVENEVQLTQGQMLAVPKENKSSAQAAFEAGDRAFEAKVAPLEGDPALAALRKVSKSGTSLRRRKLAIPPTFFEDIFGSGRVLSYVIAAAYDSLRDPVNDIDPHYTDVRAFLVSELEAAFDFLSEPEIPTASGQTLDLWYHCTPQLAMFVRQRRRFLSDDLYEKLHQSGGSHRLHDDGIGTVRGAFFEDIRSYYPRASYSTTASLAWAILVEAALLNDELNEDMKTWAGLGICETDCGFLAGIPYHFCGPHVTQEAKEAFEDYVQCRWPIHVFAIDPVTQDQNVADAFSRRREMQLALSLAFAQGRIGASHFMRYARRLELDMETIALNRTQVGFGHGNETFGWRFYPRVQSPPTEGNLTVFLREFVIGAAPERHELRRQKLEPGPRECVAIVLMPSFLPHVRVDVRSNWLELGDPSDKVLSLEDTLELSEDIQSLHHLSTHCFKDVNRYRPGELERLMRAVDQLEARLPLQTAYVQIPYENTLGGFEMFANGQTDLGPELNGWYGAPGIKIAAKKTASSTTTTTSSPDGTTTTQTVTVNVTTATPAQPAAPRPTSSSSGPVTTLFLVGDRFSVHETKVIAGGREVEYELLSRQVMEARIPEDVMTVPDPLAPGKKAVDVHVATPYGVSGHLLIPIDNSEAQAVADALKKHEAAKHPISYKWEQDSATGCIVYDVSGNVTNFCLATSPLKIVDESRIPFEQFSPISGELAAWVTAKDKDGKKERMRLVAGPIRLEFRLDPDKLKHTFLTANCQSELEHAIRNALRGSVPPASPSSSPNLTRDFKAVGLEVEGFVRFCEAIDNLSHSDALPVVKLDNVLKIKVSECPKECCTTSADPPQTPQSADEPLSIPQYEQAPPPQIVPAAPEPENGANATPHSPRFGGGHVWKPLTSGR